MNQSFRSIGVIAAMMAAMEGKSMLGFREPDFGTQYKSRNARAKFKMISPQAEKLRKRKRRISNASRKINQAKARM